MASLSPIALAALERARQHQQTVQARRLWTPEEEADLAAMYPDAPMPALIEHFQREDKAIYNKAKSMGLKRSPEYLASDHACRLRKGDNVGAAHRFKTGQTPWNKGRKGVSYEGCKATQFRKGNKPHTWVPVGTEQIRDGYLWRKVTDHGGRFDWKQVHVMLWEHRHGPVPDGLILVFRDRNKQNIQLDNLELVTRAELCRRNSIHRYPPEVKELIRLQKRLEREIRKKANEESDD